MPQEEGGRVSDVTGRERGREGIVSDVTERGGGFGKS